MGYALFTALETVSVLPIPSRAGRRYLLGLAALSAAGTVILSQP